MDLENTPEKKQISIPKHAALEAEAAGLKLLSDDQGVFLTDGTIMLRGGFSHMLPRLKKNNLLQELIVKAAKIKKADHTLRVLDATAGMGEDSLLLAAAGFKVDLYEYNAVIAALLRDSLRAAADDPLLSFAVSNMKLIEADSIAAMKNIADKSRTPDPDDAAIPAVSDGSDGPSVPDIILLDPMFPEREKSALIKKKFQLLQQLERPCADESELLEAAIAAHPHKIIIKRPLKGPYLAGKRPDYSLKGKAIRYDCIVLA
ncbi:MAG: class I SAM-dependent methyltransferase [Eubacteriales bacterium]|nr:class I SAM-dependent methyltransferase [Eubacteriales bacterium]